MEEEVGRAWVCGACGRRVPPHIERCRCGSERPAHAPSGLEPETSSPDTAQHEPAVGVDQRQEMRRTAAGRTVRPFVLTAAGLLVLAGVAVVAYRMGTGTPAPPASVSAQSAQTPGELQPQANAAAGSAADVQPPRSPVIELPPDLLPASPSAGARPTAPLPAPSAVEDVIQRVLPAVALIESQAGRGTGFFAGAGLVVTNAHVVGSQSSVTLRLADGQAVTGQVVRSLPGIDLAIVRPEHVSGSPGVLPLRASSEIRVGQEVLAVGSALGVLQNTVTRGIVSAIRNAGGVTLIQTDAAVNPGNSGGPLVDRQGYVLGVTTLKVGGGQAESLGFAVASDHARPLLEGRYDQAPASGGTLQERLQTSMTGDQRGSGDRAREDATEALEKRVKAIAEAADRIDSSWREYRPSCLRAISIPRGYEREWFVLFDKTVNPSPACAAWTDDLTRAAHQVRTAMSDSLGVARRAGVLPGDLRDLCRTYKLEWAGW
jgi:S1-C subfamily serine protease